MKNEELGLIRHKERSKALLINTKDIDLAKSLAEKYLKEIETTETYFKISSFGIWRKDPGFIKIEYISLYKESSDYINKLREINSRVFNLDVIEDSESGKGKYTLENIGMEKIESKLYGSTIIDLAEIRKLNVGERYSFSSTQENEYGGYDYYKFEIKRLS